MSLFPPFLLELYRILITPIGGGKVAAMMVGELQSLWVFVFESLFSFPLFLIKQLHEVKSIEKPQVKCFFVL